MINRNSELRRRMVNPVEDSRRQSKAVEDGIEEGTAVTVFDYLRLSSTVFDQRMQIHVGMSGFAYKEWKGIFYPSDLGHDQMLRYYATQFPTVEINSTFYRMPPEKVMLDWAAEVPEHFRLCIKASRRITHNNRLKDVESMLQYLLQNVSALGAKRGPMLFQLPPNFKGDVEVLSRFLELLPRAWPIALQLRHETWFEEPVFGLLREHGISLVVMEQDDWASPIVPTSPWGYVRLHKPGYTEAELRGWLDRIRAQPWEEAYVFFQHEEDIAGPSIALQFKTFSDSAI